MSDLETMIRRIIRSELQAALVGKPATYDRSAEARILRQHKPRQHKPRVFTNKSIQVLTPGQKAARTRKLRAAGYKAWETRRRNRSVVVP